MHQWVIPRQDPETSVSSFISETQYYLQNRRGDVSAMVQEEFMPDSDPV